MAALPPEVQASYVVIIDDILAKSDLNTITSKKVRQGLQNAVDYDVSHQKDAIKTLIAERFEKVLADKNSTPTVNGNGADHSAKAASYSPPPKKTHKRKSESEEEDDISDVVTSPPPKKKPRKPTDVEDDAAFAARLQAEENIRARPTRTGSTRKSAPSKRKSPKKKTASKVRVEDDSDLDSGADKERKVNRSGGFHKPLNLSEPLSALLDGETQMSRPQAVKRIWEYVKERDLQDPSDKRQIRCDDRLRAVFKSDKVHMFTMNKILSQNLYDPEA